MGNNTKYDDLTLMQYADGELDKTASEQLEQDLVDNQELQDRLLVFTATREAMIGINTKIPKHIEDLIDQQDGISEDDKVIRFSEKGSTQNGNIGDGTLAYDTDNKVANFFRSYPIQSLAASVMFGLLIGSQSMQGLYTSPESDLLMDRPFKMQMAVNLNNQLIKTRSELQKTQEKLSLATGKTSVLGDEMSAMIYVGNNTNEDTSVTLKTSAQGLALTYVDTTSDGGTSMGGFTDKKINYYSDKTVSSLDIPPDLTTSSSQKAFKLSQYLSETQPHDAIVSQFIDKLKNDPTIKEGEVKVEGGTVQLVHSFVNTNKQPCKLIEANNQYSIICQGDDKNWNVLFNSLDPELAVKF